MPFNAAGVASSINGVYQSILADHMNVDAKALLSAAWESAYHADAMAGVCPIAAVGPPANSAAIKQGIEAMVNNSGSDINALAQAFADYWATSHLTPTGSAVAIVGNDAATKVSAYKSAIQGCITDQDTQPYFENLLKAVEDVTKTIIWTGVTSTGSSVTGTIS